ncbi:hypothetical protein P43SY_010009 [Pythium insidiosum]|uniref:Uncharacterized protein n=1 Tax=Pythium insidiosum TaxID=114742 RepID=A0AAD5LTX7_PYTIN|nr:hypothetical protein P43SY_010009 [Pythium insidiosum]
MTQTGVPIERPASPEGKERARDEDEDLVLQHYTFLPEHLRHYLRRQTAEDDAAERDAVRQARRTRSAALVASILYEPPAPETENQATARRPSPRKRKAPRAKPKTPLPSTAATPPQTPRLYSAEVEHELTKRMTLDHAVGQLELYTRELELAIDSLDASLGEAWVWDASRRVATSSQGSVALPTLLQLHRRVVQTVASCLPDCDVYLAVYNALPLADVTGSSPTASLRYVAASPFSAMLQRVLPRDGARAVSLETLDTLEPTLIADIATAPALRRVEPRETATGPFACLALVDETESRALGVLGVDACRRAQSLRPENMTPQALFEFLQRKRLPDAAVELQRLRFGGRQLLAITEVDLQHRPAYRHLKIATKKRLLELIAALKRGVPLHLVRPPRFFADDDDVLAFLDDVVACSGRFLDWYARRVHWHRVLARTTLDPNATSLDVYAALVLAVGQALVGVERVSVWKISEEGRAIDAIASTQLPDDRLLPFLHWNERQMRRVALYAESRDLDGRLIQGTIQRIVLSNQPNAHEDEDSDGAPVSDPLALIAPRQRTCERATYHVSWSNRTQQTLSWRQLRQHLAVRPMNAKHHQLAQLLQRVRDCDRQPPAEPWRLADPNAFVFCWSDPGRPDDVVYALQADFAGESAAASERDPASMERHREQFLARAVSITRRHLACVRGREARTLHRQLSTVKTTREFHSVGISPSGDALRALQGIVDFVFAEIEGALPGTQQQIAELAADGSTLRYMFAGGGSTLRGRELQRNVGVVSFRCLDTRSPLIVGPQSELRARLRVLSSSPTAGTDEDLPYVLVPLVHDDLCLGVLSVNRFIDVPKGRPDEPQPEHGVVDYLLSVARPLATALYAKRRSHALFELQQLGLEPLRTPQQLFLAACKALQDVMVGLWKTRVVHVDFARGKSTALVDWTESERQAATTTLATRVLPLGLRVDELLPDTIGAHWREPTGSAGPSADELLRVWAEHDAAFHRDREEWRLDMVDPKQSAQAEHKAAAKRGAHATVIPDSELRRRDNQLVRDRYYRLEPEETGGGGLQTAARATNPKYLSHALQRFFLTDSVQYASVASLDRSGSDGSAVFLATALLPQFLASGRGPV